MLDATVFLNPMFYIAATFFALGCIVFLSALSVSVQLDDWDQVKRLIAAIILMIVAGAFAESFTVKQRTSRPLPETVGTIFLNL